MAEIEELEKQITDKCPKCGSDNLRLEVHDSCWVVCCKHCFSVRGKYCLTPEEAVKAWNETK